MLHSTPQIDTELSDRLAELDRLHQALALELQQARAWDGTLRREAEVDAVVSSTSIEGYTVPAADALALVSGVQPAPDDPDDRWAVSCYARAMDHVRVMADDPLFRWLDRVVLDLHYDACLYQRGKTPGRIRTTPIYVSAPPGGHTYHAPDPSDVASLLQECVEWMERGDLETHVAVRAAMAHLHLVSIHPFRDGNGRISRLVQSLMLARAGVLTPALGSIEGHLARHTERYYRELQDAQGPTWDPTRSARAWVGFCIDAHIEQATRFDERRREIAARWNALEHVVTDRGWPERLVIALEQALANGVTRSSYAAEIDASPATAAGDLRRLTDAGLIERRGGGRSSRYVASPALRSIVPG